MTPFSWPNARLRRGLVLTSALSLVGLALAVPSALAEHGYVVNHMSSSVSVIDTNSNQVIGTVPVGSAPTRVAVTPDGRTAYVTNHDSNNVSAIDTQTNQVVATIPVGEEPSGVAITPDGSRAYVANYGATTVSVIDTKTNQILGAPIVVGSEPEGLAITPDGKRVLVARYGPSVVETIDTSTEQLSGSPIPTGEIPSGIAITPDGSRAYVTDFGDDDVTVIDLATNKALPSTIKVGKYPRALAISPDGSSVYVANFEGKSVTAISTQTEKATGSPIPAGEYATGVSFSPNGAKAYVVDSESKQLSIIDAHTNQVLATKIGVGTQPFAMAIAPAQTPLPAFNFGRARPGVPVSLDASASSDPGGSIATFSWAFGDGQSAAGPVVTHAFAAPGTSAVTLKVDNGEACPGLLFSGQTAFCGGPSFATTTKELSVAYPGVRLGCPKGTESACSYRLRAIAKRPKRGKKPKVESAVAKAHIKPGKTAVVSLKPKKAFAQRLAVAKKVLVAVSQKLGKTSQKSYRQLKIVG